MNSQLLFAMFTATVAVYGQWGGTQTRRAEIRGGGGDGKCTIEVEVDDVAEVEIRGDSANLRTRSGQRASWRRFVCNQVLPPQPGDFRFRGIDGRGRQQLVNDPRNGGVAVIRIEDTKGGSEGYTFDIEWRGQGGAYTSGGYQGGGQGGGYPSGGYQGGGYPSSGYPNSGYPNSGQGGGWGNDGGPRGSGGGNWNGNSGSTFNFRGDGNGVLNRRNGRDERVRDVEVTLSRNGRVRLSFEAPGNRRMNFVGRADRYSRDSVYTELRGSNTGGNTRGSATIYLDPRGEVDRIEMTGRNENEDFRMQWRAR